jgi:hypothetical protein
MAQMDFFQPKKKKPSELFARAMVFGIFFIIVLIFFISTTKNEKSLEVGSQLLNGMAKYKGFEEKQKDELKLRNAGFWQFASDTNTANPMLFLTDRFELKPNGIFWQVTEYTIGLPSRKSTRFMHVVTGYMNPFAKTSGGLDSIVCDVHIIRHVYVMGADTCYGPSNNDTTWNVVANGKRFELGDKVYTAYDTSGQSLFKFFPAGALDIIDKPRDKSYQIANKTVFLAKNKAHAPDALKSMETFDFCQCRPGKDFYGFLKSAVAADMRTVKVDTLNEDAIQKIIDAYYRLLLENTVKNAMKAQKTRRCNLKAAFDVTWEGTVANCSIVAISVRDEQLKNRIVADIGSWTFPPLKSSAPSKHIEREFWF